MERRDACAICGSDSPERKVELAYDEPPVEDLLNQFYDGRVDFSHLRDGTYSILYCPHCDFYWKEYVLDDAGMTALYAEWTPDAAYGRRPPNRYNDHNTETKIEDASRVKTYFERHPSDVRVLDFGAGWSHFAQIAHAFGFDTYVYEHSEDKLAVADEHGLSTVDSLDRLSEMTFDYVHVNHVLEHVPDPASTVETVSEILADDGLCYLSVPHASYRGPFSERVVRDRAIAFHPLEHVNAFTPRSLRAIAREHGLHSTTPPQPSLSPSCARKHLHRVLERERVKLPVHRLARRLRLRELADSVLGLFPGSSEKYTFVDSEQTFADIHFQARPATSRTMLDELRSAVRMLFDSSLVTSLYVTKR